MPQLMPLMWVMSILMVSFILMVMIDLFFYSTVYNLFIKLQNEIVKSKKYLW